MAFPVWEGPVMLTQVFGLFDVCLASVTSACWIWTAVALVCILLAFSIVGFAAYRIHECIMAGDLKWKKSKIKPLVKIRQEFNEIHSMKEKVSACFLIVFAMRFSGEWTTHGEKGEFWSFLVKDFTSMQWLFYFFKIFSKFLNAFAVNVVPGSCFSLWSFYS